MNNETIKMKSINVDGVEIIKDVPAELYSNYIAIGWEKVENKVDEVKKEKPSIARTIKIDKEVD